MPSIPNLGIQKRFSSFTKSIHPTGDKICNANENERYKCIDVYARYADKFNEDHGTMINNTNNNYKILIEIQSRTLGTFKNPTISDNQKLFMCGVLKRNFLIC